MLKICLISRTILLSIASNNLLTSWDTNFAKRKLRTRSTTLIVKSRSLRSFCFKFLNHAPQRLAFSLNLAKESLVKEKPDRTESFDLSNLALNQISHSNTITISKFLGNSNSALIPHITREDNLRRLLNFSQNQSPPFELHFLPIFPKKHYILYESRISTPKRVQQI